MPNNDYLIKNPFKNLSVGEDEIWAEHPAPEGFIDVPEINSEAFEKTLKDIHTVSQDPDKETRLRFLVGASGSGKSHIFARLKRSLKGRGWFAIAMNPPANPYQITSHLLRSIIRSLKHPMVVDGHTKEYSQIQALVYELIRANVMKENSIDDIHEIWLTRMNNPVIPKAGLQRDEIIDSLTVKLSAQFPAIDSNVLKALLNVPRHDVGLLAVDWLAGADYLRDEDLDKIGQREPLDEQGSKDLIYFLGKVSAPLNVPMVLVLDQLDAISDPALISTYSSLLMGLRDQSKNWSVIVSLLNDKFNIWAHTLSSAFVGRFNQAVMDAEGSDGVLAVATLENLTPEQKARLVKMRLSSSALAELRERDGKDSLYPLTQQDVDSLSSNKDLLIARQLLAKASEVYTKALTGKDEAKRPLSDVISSKLNDLIDEAKAEYPNPAEIATGEISARALELVSLSHGGAAHGGPEPGPLHRGRHFRGVDTKLTGKGSAFHLVCHDIQQGNVFPSVLEKLNSGGQRTLLLRNGRVRATGRVTTERLKVFMEQGNVFIHLTDEELYLLCALGKLLALMREGDLKDLNTDPPPTEENIKGVLSGLDAIKTHRLTQKVKAITSPGADPTPAPVPKPLPPPDKQTQPLPPTRPLPVGVNEQVKSIMKREHWLALERLRWLLINDHPTVAATALFNMVKHIDEIRVHPTMKNNGAEFVILIWQGEG